MNSASRRASAAAAIGRRGFLGSLCGGLFLQPPKSPPNIVFILIDDLGWADLTCYGSRYHETPHIDRLAREGVRFTNAYAAAPLCSASRASILTGKYPARLHLTTALPGTLRARPAQRYLSPQMPPGLPLEEVTIAEALKPAGYACGYVGKWHLGAQDYFPERQGFDVNVGKTSTGMAPGFFYPAWAQTGRAVHVEGRPGDYLTDRLTDESLSFLESNRSKPFFLMLSHFAVHTFIQAKPALTEKYRRKKDPAGVHNHPVYAAMLESVDESVGRIMQKLDELRVSENTVVIFASDNGGEHLEQRYTKDPLPPTSNYPLREGKSTLYEGGIRVPMIVRGPGIRPGRVSDIPTISADFLPTIADMAGRGRVAEGIDGVSLAPVLRGGRSVKREALFWYFPHYDPRPVAAVRQGRFKLMEFLDDSHLELYDLADDIGEKNNLAGKLKEKSAEMQGMLRRWLKSTGANGMSPNPGYVSP